MPTYETNVDAILAELDTQLKAISGYDADSVFKHSFLKLTKYPSCVVNLLNDRVTPAAAQQWHDLLITITVFEDGSAKTADDLIEAVGLIVDKLDTLKTNADKWTLCAVNGEILYGFAIINQVKSFVAVIPLIIRKKW